MLPKDLGPLLLILDRNHILCFIVNVLNRYSPRIILINQHREVIAVANHTLLKLLKFLGRRYTPPEQLYLLVLK